MRLSIQLKASQYLNSELSNASIKLPCNPELADLQMRDHWTSKQRWVAQSRPRLIAIVSEREFLTLPEPSHKHRPCSFDHKSARNIIKDTGICTLRTPSHISRHHASTTPTNPSPRVRISNTHQRNKWQPNNPRNNQCRPQYTERHSPPTSRAPRAKRHPMG